MIMANMVIWLAIAAIIAAILINFAIIPIQAQVIILLAAALMVWRIAIATYKLRQDERAAQRKLDEESVCSDVVMHAWESNTESRRPRMIIDYDSNGNPVVPGVEAGKEANK